MNTLAKPYHHGNLKEELVKVFTELLESTPYEKLSLRKIASEVGVAPTAVYNHFKSKEELQTAAKIKCMMHLADYLDQSVIGIESPEDKICELSKAYYHYSREYAPYFEFTMGANVPKEYVTDELLEVSMRAEEALRIAVNELFAKHDIPTDTFNEGLGTFGCWGLAHGISDLANKSLNLAACRTGRWSEEFLLREQEQINACFQAMTDAFVQGLLVAAKTKLGR